MTNKFIFTHSLAFLVGAASLYFYTNFTGDSATVKYGDIRHYQDYSRIQVILTELKNNSDRSLALLEDVHAPRTDANADHAILSPVERTEFDERAFEGQLVEDSEISVKNMHDEHVQVTYEQQQAYDYLENQINDIPYLQTLTLDELIQSEEMKILSRSLHQSIMQKIMSKLNNGEIDPSQFLSNTNAAEQNR